MKTRCFISTIFLMLLFQSMLQSQVAPFTKVYYDLSGSAQAFGMVRTWDDNYILAGEKDNTALIMKVSAAGDILLSRQVGPADSSVFYAITATHDSGFVLAGQQNELNLPGDVYVVKVNAALDTVWTRLIPLNSSAYITAIRMTSDHGFILAGSLASPPANNDAMLVIRLDQDGNLVWCKTYQSTVVSNARMDDAYNVHEMPSGGFLVTGHTITTMPYIEKGCLLCLSASGSIDWVKTIESNSCSAWDAYITSSGITFLGASSNNGAFLLRTDLSGNFQWAKNTVGYNGGSYLHLPMPGLCRMSDGGFAFYTALMGPSVMMRTDSLGNTQYARELWMNPAYITDAGNNNLMILGNGPIMAIVMGPTKNPQIGLIRLDSTGLTPQCVNPLQPETTSMTVTLANATFTSATAGGPPVYTAPVSAAAPLSVYDGCVEIYGGVPQHSGNSQELIISPNPTHGMITVGSMLQRNGKLRIWDSLGKLVFSAQMPASGNMVVDLTEQPDGIYYCRMETISGSLSGKVVKQH